MSRVGNKPIKIPTGVDLSFAGGTARAKGPKGELSRSVLAGIEIDVKDGEAVVRELTRERRNRAAHGLTRALINNMVQGVTTGFSRTLEIQGTGYRAQVQGQKLVLTLGYSHPIEYGLPAGIQAKVDQNRIVVSGIDRELVGQVAAEIRRFRPPEPYKGKGIRYDKEHVRRKAGKSAGA
jgi:large subunit ribosomal protein L6